jgi:hypothetical protein
VLPSIVAAQPPASPPRAPRRPISSRWRLPSHHSTASAVFRPNQSPTLHGPSDRSAGGNSTPPPSPLTSNPHSPALPSRLPHPRDFVPWRFSDACRRRAPTPASPLGRPTNLHNSGSEFRTLAQNPEAALGEFRKWVDQNILESRVRKNAAQSRRRSESCPGTVAAGQTVFVFAVCRAATTIDAFEDELILECDPPWNRTHLKRRNVRKMSSTLKLRLRRP